MQGMQRLAPGLSSGKVVSGVIISSRTTVEESSGLLSEMALSERCPDLQHVRQLDVLPILRHSQQSSSVCDS